MDRSTSASVAAHARSVMLCSAVYMGLTAAFLSTTSPAARHPRSSSRSTRSPLSMMGRPEPSRPNWMIAPNPCTAAQGSSSSALRSDAWDTAQIADVLVNQHQGDLVRLAQKFGELIERVEDVETISIADLDGDHMQLDVVYCDQGEQTCVAVAVPIAFPHHCDDGECVIDAIHDLEEMEGVVAGGGEVKLPQKAVSPELMETIARICVVMNRDFQDELAGFVRAYGGDMADKPLGGCEMLALTPDGFQVKAALRPHDPVSVAFSRECLTASDFQRQILEISQQAMMYA